MLKQKWVFILLAYILFPIKAFSLGANAVSIEANQYVSVGQPIEVSVMVTHEKTSKVELESFKLGDEPLTVRFAKEVSMSENSDLVISIYKFLIKPKKKGLYTIPPVSVKIGGKEFASFEGSYTVQ